MEKRIGVVHVYARCEDCGKEFVNYKNGQALAALHAKTHRHRVSGDVALGFIYDGKK